MKMLTKVSTALVFAVLFATFPSSELTAVPFKLDSGTEMREKASDFALPDTEGRPFKLSDHKGRPVLLIFGTTWCPTCISKIPHFKDIYNTYQKRGLVMVNIDVQESQAKVSSFVKKYGIPYRVLLDEKGEVARRYGIVGVPDMTLIDKRGMIVCTRCESVERLIERALKEK